MITYPVDVDNTQWAVYQVSTSSIIDRRRIWPNGDGSEISGLDPDYIYLRHVDDAKPQYDSRLYTLVGTESIDIDANIIQQSWDALARPNEERFIAAENEEMAQIGKHINISRELVETRLMLGALLFYVIDAQQFPPKALAMSEAYKAKALKFWSNRDRLAEILTDISNGNDPDFDTGWADE